MNLLTACKSYAATRDAAEAADAQAPHIISLQTLVAAAGLIHGAIDEVVSIKNDILTVRAPSLEFYDQHQIRKAVIILGFSHMECVD